VRPLRRSWTEARGGHCSAPTPPAPAARGRRISHSAHHPGTGPAGKGKTPRNRHAQHMHGLPVPLLPDAWRAAEALVGARGSLWDAKERGKGQK